MAQGPASRRSTGGRPRRGLARRWNRAVRRFRQTESNTVVVLVLLTFVLAWLALRLDASTGFIVPVTVLVIPMVLADLVLSPRSLPWVVGFVLLVLVAVVLATSAEVLVSRNVGAMITAFAVGLIILVASFRRSRLGVAGSRGESMFVDLRDRIARQGQMPTLPPDWYSDTVLRSAGGSKFAGDFMVAAKSLDRTRLQIVLVDVSGKGEQAGTRSLLLSGAFGGLLGALPVERFLPAANEYLLAQDWSEGFATAVHLAIDLRTGDFEVRSAGHPPAVQFNAGSGRWTVQEVDGPVLGLLDGAEFSVRRGTVQRGDAVMLYTDGVVETPTRDISLGIDRLVGEAERLFRNGFERGATRLVDRLSLGDDDQALMVLHRR